MDTTPADPKAWLFACSEQHAIRPQRSSNYDISNSQQGSVPRPQPSASRLASSANDCPFISLEQFVKDAPLKCKDETVLYLAYGSNLSAETFGGFRGIKPISQINVQVPSLRLTFDLPGIPYKEPCFASSRRRDPNNDPPRAPRLTSDGEKTPFLDARLRDGEDAEKEWHKGMIGVVYEVTPQDYAHIIATEGGYQDIVVDCHPFECSDPSAPVSPNPTTPSFKAHTLFTLDDGSPRKGGHRQRPDPTYAQPSARYLKLITDGAAECALPYEYQEYLLSLKPYTITTKKQQMGRVAFLVIWLPLVVFLVFGLQKAMVGKDGKLPPWLTRLIETVFEALWTSYDLVFKPTFGDGERTQDGIRKRAKDCQQRYGADLEKGAI